MLNLNYRPVPAYRQAGNAAQCGEAQLFLSATLAQTFNNRSSALTGAAITVPALAEPFIAAGAAVGLFAVFYCFLKVLMVSSYRIKVEVYFHLWLT